MSTSQLRTGAAAPRGRARSRVAVVGVAALGASLVSVTPSISAGSPARSPAAPGPAAAPSVATAGTPAYLDATLPVRKRVADLLRRMTLQEKIGQMTQAERAAVADDPTRITQWQLGSVLSGGGSTPAQNTPAAWVEMVNQFQRAALATRLHIPLIYGIDAVHGHGNVYGATIFPHNVGLGSTRDPALVQRVGRATAEEVRATGIPWDFAPCVCVTRDERWGRTYESFGEDPALVIRMETIINGLQGYRTRMRSQQNHVLATTKHFAGDGDTEYGTSSGDYKIDQGVDITTWRHFRRIDLSPYVPAVRTYHTGSIMPSYSSVDWVGDGVGNPIKMHQNRALITGWLKEKIGFHGFVISDYNGIQQLPGDYPNQVRLGVNAGIDMFMEPNTAQQFETTLLAEVNAGHVSMARINDAVRRILRQKFLLGLFEHPYAGTDNLDQVGSAEHRAIARKAAAESQALLKNSGHVLPLRPDAKVYVAGRNADNIGNQAGGWTITWQGESGNTIPGTTILGGIRQVAPHAQVTYSEDASAPTAGSDVGVVVVGETPYSEGFGDVGGPQWAYDPADNGQPREPKTLTLKEGDKAVVDKVCSALPRCVVLIVSGRPQVVTDQLPEIDGLVASWLPGSEGEGVADVLFGRRAFTGQLAQTWPRSAAQVPINVGDANYRPLYPFGWGLRTDSARLRLSAAVRAAAGRHTDAAMRTALRDLRRALAAANWRPDGSVRRDARVLPQLAAAAAALQWSSAPGAAALEQAIASVARDVAQAAVVAGTAPASWAKLIARADHALLAGNADRAVSLLIRVARG